jgi:HPt (histidine-containing phosphotransfer) domain-containing protein
VPVGPYTFAGTSRAPETFLYSQQTESNDLEGIFDEKTLVKYLGGKREHMGDVMKIFVEESSSLVKEIKTATEKGDAALLKLQSHSLKGSAANVGAHRLRNIASLLEKAGEAQDMESAKALLSKLEDDLDRFQSAVVNFAWNDK